MELERGRLYWNLWITQVALIVVAAVFCWGPTFWFNIKEWWITGEYGGALMATGTFATLIICFHVTEYLHWIWKPVVVVLAFWLIHMCFYGASEQVVKTREKAALDVQVAINAGTHLTDNLTALNAQLVTTKARLKAMGDPADVSDDALANVKEARDEANRGKCGVWSTKKKSECDKAKTDAEKAQKNLETAQSIHDLYVTWRSLDERINTKTAEGDRPILKVDTNKKTADGYATYVNSMVPSFASAIIPEVKAETLANNRPYNITLTGELLASLGMFLWMKFLGGSFDKLRSIFCRKKVAEPMRELVEPVREPEQPMREPVQTENKRERFTPEPEKITLRPARRESVREWFKLHCSNSTGSKTPKDKARGNYEAWCADNGEEPVTASMFGIEIAKLGATKRKEDSRNYYDISLKPNLTVVRRAEPVHASL